ncbi:MAG: hypothetical protein RLY97_17 [Pseudomonadota bacterium]|jgi:diguanylate cyclase
MTAHDPALHAPRNGILGWLGLGRNSDVPTQLEQAIADDVGLDPVRAARMQLVSDVGRFMLVHDLEVTTFTLAVAHDFLTQADPRMSRLIEKRIQAGQPITIEWLEQANADGGDVDDREALTTLMTKLEGNLEEFGKTSTAARSAANSYSSALEAQVDGLNNCVDAPVMISELASLAKSMLDRTRELEREMSRSELQTKTLRRSLEQAKNTADKDHLTGLPNRRAFEGLLDSEYALAQANKEPLCVAFCDIDFFKKVNDTHGHDAGDRVLKAVAQSLSRISDDKCHVARHGGEEFVALFRGKTVNEAWELLDDTRAQQAERRMVNRANDEPFGKITFSGGLADVFVYGDPRAALKAADAALYRAKDEGRNRIIVAPKPAP